MPVRTRSVLISTLFTIILFALVPGASAAPGDGNVMPTASEHEVLPLAMVERMEVEPVPLEMVMLEDLERESQGLPYRYALTRPTSITPENDGTWEGIGESLRLWRLRIVSPGAMSLNLGFTRYFMPPGGRLLVYDTATRTRLRAFGSEDNEDHGQLWTPVVTADDIMIEVTIPTKAVPALQLELTSVNVGYRDFGEIAAQPAGDKSGACNIDVICPEGDLWRDEIPSVAVISISGIFRCTGFLINNTAEDETPYFMTANHCGLSGVNASTLVVYWNFQSPTCGLQGGGSLEHSQTGSLFRASYSQSDFTLVELDDAPDPRLHLSYAGWDRGDDDPVSAVAIHHPSTDEKSISFEYDPCFTTSYLQTTVPGNGTHIRVVDWDDGTTEGGSSGSPLFNENHHVVGQLHGGFAACGNDLSDWYGRISVSWEGGGTSVSRLRDWLDPLGSGPMTLNLLAPGASGMRVAPNSALAATGDPGGPFNPGSSVYTLQNRGEADIGYLIQSGAGWLSVDQPSGVVPAQNTIDVTISLNSHADALPAGRFQDSVAFINTTNGEGNTVRAVTLEIGEPEMIYAFKLEHDPGWTRKGDWEHGHPLGLGGEHGFPDPEDAHSGENIYGYNLAGDYKNLLLEKHLTTSTFDCSRLSGVKLRFWRWLGVESSIYDHASVRVSNDGSEYHVVWQNSGEITDSEWTPQEYDISAIADGQRTVYVRWVLGPTDSSWRYCGWNIDDVEIWALEIGLSGTAGGGQTPQIELLPNVPNPFNPRTEISFVLSEPAQVRLTIFDARGRAIRTLLSGHRDAGKNTVVWNACDDAGRPVGSGTYIYRLDAGGMRLQRKMTLLR